MTTAAPDAAQRRAATVAGVAYFVIIVTSILSISLGPSQLTMGGAIPSSLQDIADQQLVFRVGAVYDLLMYAGVVLLSVALYRVLQPIGQGVALLALLWRLGEAVFGCVTVIASLAVVRLALGDGSEIALGPEERMAFVLVLLQVIADSLSVLLVFLCLGTILNCYLFFVSRYIPRWLSVWGIASCAVMLTAGIVKFLAPDIATVPEAVGSLAVRRSRS